MKQVTLPISSYAGFFNGDLFNWLRDNNVEYDFAYDPRRSGPVALIFSNDDDATAFALRFKI